MADASASAFAATLGPIAAALVAIGATVAVIDLLTTSFAEAKEKADDAISAYKGTASEVESMRSELDTTRDRINELEAKGSLSFVEQAELNNLQAQNDLLEKQIAIRERLAEYQLDQARGEAKTFLESKTFQTGILGGEKTLWKEIVGALVPGLGGSPLTDKDIIDYTIGKQRELTELQGSVGAWLEYQKELEPGTMGYEDVQQEIDALNAKILQNQGIVAANMSTISQYESMLYDDNGKVIEGYEDLAVRIKQLNSEVLGYDVDAAKTVSSILSKATLKDSIEAAKKYALENNGITEAEVESMFGDIATAAGDQLSGVVDAINSEVGTLNFDKVRKQLVEAFDTKNMPELNSWTDWINNLGEEDLRVLYGIYAASDTGAWTFEDWKQALADAKAESESASETIGKTFASMMQDESFAEGVDNYIAKIGKLQEALKKFESGEMEASDLVDLFEEFPELANNTDDLGAAIEQLINQMNDAQAEKFASALNEVSDAGDKAALQNYADAVLAIGQAALEAENYIESMSDGISKLQTAMSESNSGTGLTADSIKSLVSRYKDLDGYDPAGLFERTANGIHLNRQELDRLETAYISQQKAMNAEKLQNLIDQYDALTIRINENTDAAHRAELAAQRDSLLPQIQECQALAAEYDGLTSAYNRWQTAKSAGSESDIYKAIAGNLENIQGELDLGWVTNETRQFIDMLSSADLSSASFNEVYDAWERLHQTIAGSGGYSAMDFFTFDEDNKLTTEGLENFLEACQNIDDQMVSWDGKQWNIDFGLGKDAEMAERLGIDVEMLQAMLRALVDAGDFNISLDTVWDDVDLLKTKAEQAASSINTLRSTLGMGEEYTFHFNSTDADVLLEDLETAIGWLDYMNSEEVAPDVDPKELENMQTIVVALARQLAGLGIIDIDTSTVESTLESLYGKDWRSTINFDGNTEEADEAVEETVENANNSTGTVTIDGNNTPAKSKIQEIANTTTTAYVQVEQSEKFALKNGGAPQTLSVSANVTGTDQINNLNSAANSVSDKVAKIAARVSGTDQVLRLVNAIRNVASKTVVVTAKTLGTAMVQNLHSAISNLRDKTVTVTTNYVTTGSSGGSTRGGDRIGYVSVNGTAHASGTANASGNWGTKQRQRALVGELGREIVVDPSTGTWHTVGDNGAQFVDIPKGAIVFNHKQTEDLLKNGWVTGRGKALASGTAMSSGSGSFRRGSGSSGSSGSSGQSSTYIETVNNYYSGVSSTGTVSDVAASSAFEDMYKYHQHMLNMEKEAVEDYLTWLDSAYQQAYANGEIELDDFYKYEEEIYGKRKELAEDWFNDRQHQIDLLSKRTDSSYMRYDIDAAYEQLEIQKQMRAEAERLAAEARAYGLDNDSEYLQSLTDKWWETDAAIAQIYNDMFDRIETRYGHYIDEIEDKQKLIETRIELMQTNGERISAEYYDELIALEEDHQKELEAELAHLESALAEAVDSGAILEYSDDWYEVKDAIRDVNQELADSALAVAKYRKEMLSLFNDIESGYSNAFGAIDHAQNMLSADMTMLQYMAHTTTGELTEQLVAYERARQTVTEDLLHEYQNELKKLIADNKIEVGDSSYYEWMEKIWSAQESLMNSRNKINQYQQQEFQNISDEYSRQLGRITNQATDLQNQISTVETRGYVAGASFYNALIDNEQKQIEMLDRQREAMQNYLTKLIAEGQIQVGSAQWYEMQSAIDGVTNSINSGALAIEQYQKKLRDLKNEQFDYSMDLVGDLNSEAEFLIKLAEYTNDSVKNWDRAYRDANGQIGSMDIPGVGDLTDEGWTVMGLHAQEYATYMDMARRYAEERAKIESQLAEDPYNKELMERYRSIINLQRQSIENQYKERDAIKSLVEDGIKAELDGLKELISYYEESLDSAKDLHDYQKKIQDQTKTISNLEKQLSAYSGDDSEETRKTIQKLKNDLINAQEDLEETQYDQYISDQKKLLDKLYDDYEMTLNKRLDDVDGLVSQVVDNVVAKGNDIQGTMTSIASDANYAITDGTNSIWTEISSASGDITSGLSVLTTSITSETDRIYNLVESNAMTAQIKEDNSRDILAEMQANSEAWWEADEETQKRLHDRNSLLAQEYYDQTGNKLSWDSDSGYWIDSAGNHSYPVLGGNKTLDSNLIQMKANSKSWTAETGAGLEAENKRIAQNVSKQIGQPVYIDDDGVWRYGSQGKALYDYNNANALGEGTKNYAAARSLVVQMKENSKNWTEGDPNNLALENIRLAAKIGQYTDTPVFRDDASGVWYFGDKKTKLYDYFGVYHRGGIVGASTAKNEVWAKLLKNEFVLTEDQMRSVMQYNAATNAILSNGLKNINANSGVSSTHNATFNISLPSVTNYEEFANALVKDKRFEGYIQSVTVDPLAGKSKIHKNKYSW